MRITLIGARGRMGQAIVEAAADDADVEIVAQCDVGDSIASAMKNCDAAIDFSQAAAVEEICGAAEKHGRPLVIGTTGHSPEQRARIMESAKRLPIVLASNFSVGVNTLFALTGKTPAMLGDSFDVRIVETHHVMKKDAPSGTAKTLMEILKKTGKNEIPVESIREGDVVGEHTVIFTGTGETLELIHRAKSRATFAKGALRAAQWIVGKPAGLYSMQDVLGL